MKKIVLSLFVMIGMILLNFLGPYNVWSALTADNLAGHKDIQEQVEGDILDIKYLGKDTYILKTDELDYVLLKNKNSDASFLRFKVYEYTKEMEIFLNPM